MNKLNSSFRRSLREAILILLTWFGFLVWTVGYCAVYGYEVPAEDLGTVLGIPDWVFWGVGVPWVAAVGVSAWFGLSYLKDLEPEGCDGTGQEGGPSGPKEELAGPGAAE